MSSMVMRALRINISLINEQLIHLLLLHDEILTSDNSYHFFAS